MPSASTSTCPIFLPVPRALPRETRHSVVTSAESLETDIPEEWKDREGTLWLESNSRWALNFSRTSVQSHTRLCRTCISWQQRGLFQVPTRTAGPGWQRSSCHRWAREVPEMSGCTGGISSKPLRCLCCGHRQDVKTQTDLGGVEGWPCAHSGPASVNAAVPGIVGSLVDFLL